MSAIEKSRDARRLSAAADERAAGHRLRVARLTLGITEADAAAAHGITLRTYRKWELGLGRINALRVMRFAKAYHVSIHWLIDGEAGMVADHLAKRAAGKFAILPAVGPRGRNWPSTFA